MTVPEAIEVFVRAFSQGRSAVYPYLAENLLEAEGPSPDRALWTMQDAPQRKHGRRKAEVICFGFEPEEVLRRLEDRPVGWHHICAIEAVGSDLDAAKAKYKALGYRALGSESFFVHDLSDIPEYPCSLPIVRVDSRDEANAFNRAAAYQMLRPRDFAETPTPFRQYGIRTDDRFFGRVRSVPIGRDAWVADLYVTQEERGKGFGKALMAHVLKEDKRHGIRHSVLLASRDGSRVYPAVGYRLIGTLQMFCPKRR